MVMVHPEQYVFNEASEIGHDWVHNSVSCPRGNMNLLCI